MSTMKRRDFVTTASAGAVGAGLINLNPKAFGANERINLALIGGHNQGKGDATRAIKQGAHIHTFCDIDDQILRETGALIEKAQDSAPKTCKHYEDVLDDKDIDAVMIVTPDHWHSIITIQACQAGKDVYVEKPLCQTLHEGLQMVEAGRKYNRVVQTGTQRRSAHHYREAVEYAAAGHIGDICLIKAWMNQVRGSIGNPENEPVPEGVDYDRWLGPAPKRPFNKNRFHYTWRFFWDYGTSELGNQGVHMLDICLWLVQKMKGLENCLPTHISGNGGIFWLGDAKEVPDTQSIAFGYDDMMILWELHSFQRHTPMEGMAAGVGFYGTEGTIFIDGRSWNVIDKNRKTVKSESSSGGSHEGNFLECIKSRQRPNADVEIGRLSAALCQLGNITYHLGRDVHFDAKTTTFPGDDEANAMLTKAYRSPYVLPGV